jgi:hypothetical protein
MVLSGETLFPNGDKLGPDAIGSGDFRKGSLILKSF